MFQREWQRDSLGGDELRSLELAPALQVTRLVEDLLKRTHLLGLFEEKPDRLFEIPEGLLLRTTAGGHVEFSRVRHEGPAFLENLGSELNLHTLLV